MSKNWKSFKEKLTKGGPNHEHIETDIMCKPIPRIKYFWHLWRIENLEAEPQWGYNRIKSTNKILSSLQSLNYQLKQVIWVNQNKNQTLKPLLLQQIKNQRNKKLVHLINQLLLVKWESTILMFIIMWSVLLKLKIKFLKGDHNQKRRSSRQKSKPLDYSLKTQSNLGRISSSKN